MEYQGPTGEDLANISALNHLYLGSFPGDGTAGPGSSELKQLSDSERTRLAEAPFLLFSLREHDSDYWQPIFDPGAQLDLIEPASPPHGRVAALQVAGLSFLWQLVRRNPYAARIVSGAPVGWCERLAGLTLVGLLQRAAGCGDLLRMRFSVDDVIWRRLLGNGTSPRRNLRLVAHHCALQTMLARGQRSHDFRAAAAACSMTVPRHRDETTSNAGIRDTEV